MLSFDFIVLRCPTQSLSNAFKVPASLPAIFNEGLYLASPEFYKELLKIQALPEATKTKAEITLLKYWLRACTRCTPYGTFAGNIVIPVTEQAKRIILSDPSNHFRHIRIDMSCLFHLITEIERLPEVKNQLLLFPNNSIYETPLDFRYTESLLVNNLKTYKLTGVEKSEYLSFVFNLAIKGVSLNEISSKLSEFAAVPLSEAESFILELWDTQLLVSNLDAEITGANAFEKLVTTIQQFSGIDSLKENLLALQKRLSTRAEGAENYIEIESIINRVISKPIGVTHLLQTDLFLSCKEKGIDKRIIEGLVSQIEELSSFSYSPVNQDLTSFKNNFLSKYRNQLIPLAIALDADLGIGYAGIDGDIGSENVLIDDIYYPTADVPAETGDTLQEYILNKYFQYTENDQPYIEISKPELEELAVNRKNSKLPASLFLQGTLLKKDGYFDGNDFLFEHKFLVGPSCANLLGRFTQGDTALLNQIRKAIKAEEEQYPDIIFAEIVHIPQTRVGNISSRAVLRNFEIPYVGKSGIHSNQQICINDLYVCIKENEIVLISKKHNKRVMPRLSTAHNYLTNNLPLYRFLCDLQYQDFSLATLWNWGKLQQLDHLPRVIFKNIVVKKARWKIQLKDFPPIPTIPSELISAIEKVLSSKKIPNRVILAGADTEILIDFENLDSIAIFLSYLKKNSVLILQECLFSEANCIVEDSGGNPYTNEIVVPVNNSIKNSQKIEPYTFTDDVYEIKYPPGSKWLFFKVFCSARTADKLLTNYILPFVEYGKEQKLFDSFFFIRYKEHGPHLRIRFYNEDISKQGKLITEFISVLQELLDQNIIKDITIDTYIPEIERYGGTALIDKAEALFATDSLAIIKCLNMLEPGAEGNYRVLLAMKSLDILLNDFKLSLIKKREFFKGLSDSFLTEFGASMSLQKSINRKYNTLKKNVFLYMNSESGEQEDDIHDVISVFHERSLNNVNIIDDILKHLPANTDDAKLPVLLKSFVHMSINRFFIANQRKYELIIYHFLERFYTSQTFITGAGGTSSPI